MQPRVKSAALTSHPALQMRKLRCSRGTDWGHTDGGSGRHPPQCVLPDLPLPCPGKGRGGGGSLNIHHSFLKLIYFNWKQITLQDCGSFCHTSTWINHGCTCVPPSWIPSHLLPHPIPLGCPSAPTLSTLLHALNLHWSPILHMVIYMFQCYSLKSSHSWLLPKSKNLFFTSVSLLLSFI